MIIYRVHKELIFEIKQCLIVTIYVPQVGSIIRISLPLMVQIFS